MKHLMGSIVFLIFAFTVNEASQRSSVKKLEKMKPRNGPLRTMDMITDINFENDLTDLFEGDINLREEKTKKLVLSNQRKRDAQRDRRYLWHSGVVPYEISHDLENFKFMIEGALKEISSKTCIKFVKRTTEENWISFVRRSGCWSSVGKLYWRKGFQEISLGSGCLMHETVLHEVLHSLGFWHEQSRPDRDQYIEIFWENILEGQEDNFKKYSHAEADILGVQYDYASVMHYGSRSFSKNGKETMKPIRETSHKLGIATELSALDVVQLNALYDCHNGEAGGWSRWSDFGSCNDSCFKQRQRFCRHSDQSFCEGANEFGVQTESRECQKDETECFAPVNGHWGRWSSWGACSVSCDQGQRIRTRECNDPAPKYNGQPCEGASTNQENCKVKSCDLGKDDCEFDSNNFCHWVNDGSNKEGYVWLRKSGPTPSRYTGPNGDHTSGNGFYVYLEASSPAAQGYKGRLVSKLFTHKTSMCLVFYYFMYGQDMGSLRVYFYGSSSKSEGVLWQTSGDKGNNWKKQMILINPEEDFKIIFEGERGIGFKSDIAVDDVYILNGQCITENGTSSVDEQSILMTTKQPERVVAVGCYNDFGSIGGKRPFPQYVSYRHQIDWSDMSKTVSECSSKAKTLGFKYFAVEFYGECWFGPEHEVDYSRDGMANDCWNGVGTAHSMMVYKWATS